MNLSSSIAQDNGSLPLIRPHKTLVCPDHELTLLGFEEANKRGWDT